MAADRLRPTLKAEGAANPCVERRFLVRALNHSCQNFFHEFGGHHRGHSLKISCRIQLDDIGSDQGGVHVVKKLNDLANIRTSRFIVADSGRGCGIQNIEVEREISRALKFDRKLAWPVLHRHNFNGELSGLRPLMFIERADSDLEVTTNEAIFMSACERTGVRESIAFEFVVKVAVSIKLNQVDGTML